MHTPWVTMQVYLAKVNWGTDLFVSLGYIIEAQHQSRHNRPYHLCLSNQRCISVFVPAKHTKMKEKIKSIRSRLSCFQEELHNWSGWVKQELTIYCPNWLSLLPPFLHLLSCATKRKAGSHANTWNMYGQFSIDNNKHKGILKTCQ